MNKLITYSIFCLALLGCQSNSGTSTGNPLVSFKMTSSSEPTTVAFHRPSYVSPWLYEILKPALALPPPVLVDSTGLTINMNEAWIVVEKIEFKPTETAEASEVDGDDVSFTGPYIVDLLATNPESLGQARISTSVVRRIKMTLHNADTLPNTAPPALLGKSIYWTGTVNGNAFTISTAQGYQYELAGPNGVAVADNSNILMSIRIADLFKKIDLSAVTNGMDISESNRVTAANPCATIDASATDIYTCFIKGLETETNLGNDDDGDGELSGDDSVK